jgi:hypothetical protein
MELVFMMIQPVEMSVDFNDRANHVEKIGIDF